MIQIRGLAYDGFLSTTLRLCVHDEPGQVEAERHKINAPIQKRWEYRIKE